MSKRETNLAQAETDAAATPATNCTLAQGIVTPCSLLSRATDGVSQMFGRQKGVLRWDFYSLDLNAESANMDAPSAVLFGVKSGEFAKKGLVFNFCPFCGQRISQQRLQA